MTIYYKYNTRKAVVYDRKFFFHNYELLSVHHEVCYKCEMGENNSAFVHTEINLSIT